MTDTKRPTPHDIYRRGADVLPADYLVAGQPTDADRVARIVAAAAARRAARNALRALRYNTKGPRR